MPETGNIFFEKEVLLLQKKPVHNMEIALEKTYYIAQLDTIHYWRETITI